MTAILGISAFYHDSAAALVVDGKIVAAAQEERFSRLRHDAAFPRHSVAYCLREAGLTPDTIDHVVFYEKPLRKFERILETYAAFAPRGFVSFAKAIPLWVRERLHVAKQLDTGLGFVPRRPYLYTEHHEAHAASAFFPSPHKEAAIVTMDGVGEWATTTVGYGRDTRITLLEEQRFPHSLGLLYSAFTQYCGFRVNSGEYKLMGLAPHGRPTFVDTILNELIDLKDNGSFRLNLRYFDYCVGGAMTSPRFAELFGGPARLPDSEIGERVQNLAASIQAVTNEIVLRTGFYAHRETGLDKLCLAGGVALNCVAMGHLLRHGPFKDIWIQPAAGDAGGALGAALFAWHQLLDGPRAPIATDSDRQSGSLLGPAFSRDEVEAALREAGAEFETLDDESMLDAVAASIAAGEVVGWFSGRMELGPRALGSRSILADARRADMRALVNDKVKLRESFRPFAPSVLVEEAPNYFALPDGMTSPYMLITAEVREERRAQLPAITHLDHSARVQTVDATRNPRFFALLRAYARLTGCPLVLNTSFNVRGEPLVCTPTDAWRCFMATDIDVLAIEHCLLRKKRQRSATERERAAHLAKFAAD